MASIPPPPDGFVLDAASLPPPPSGFVLQEPAGGTIRPYSGTELPDGRQIVQDEIQAQKTRQTVAKIAAPVVRYGTPIAATVGAIGSGYGIPGVAVAAGSGQAVGSTAAQGIENWAGLRQGFDVPQIASDTAYAFLTPGSPQGGSFIGTVARGAGQQLVAGPVSRGIKATMENGELSSGYDSLSDAAIDLGTATGLGILGGTIEGYGQGIAKRGQAMRAGYAAGATTPGTAAPQFFADVQSQFLARGKHDMYKGVADYIERSLLAADREAMDNISGILRGVAPEDKVITEQLAPYITRLEGLESNVKGAESRLQAAREAAQQNLPGARESLTQAYVDAVNARAAKLYETQNILGKALPANKQAEETARLMEQVFKARDEIGATLFNAAGVDEAAISLGNSQVKAAIQKALGPDSNRELSRGILSYIDSIGTKVGIGEDAPRNVTLLELRDLRGKINKLAFETGVSRSEANRLGDIMYGAVTDLQDKAISQLPDGAQRLAAFQQARKYWAQTKTAEQSPLLKGLIEGNQNAAGTAWNDIASGKSGVLDDFTEFKNAVGSAGITPTAIDAAQKGIFTNLRNAALLDASADGGLNPARLADKLMGASRSMDISQLGFGNEQAVRSWQRSLRKFDLKSLSAKEADEFFGDPLVLRTMANGRQGFDLAAAKIQASRDVSKEVLANVMGIGKPAASVKRTLPKDAQNALDFARQRMQAELANDPVLLALAENKAARLPKNGTFSITDTLDNSDMRFRNQFLGALRRTNPRLYEDVQARYLADKIKSIVVDVADPDVGKVLDYTKFRNLVTQPNLVHTDLSHPYYAIRDVVGPQVMQDLEQIAQKNLLMERYQSEVAKGLRQTGENPLTSITTLSAAAMKGKLAGMMGVGQATNRSMNLIRYGKFGTFAWLMSKPSARAAYEATGNLLDAAGALGGSRAAMFLQTARDEGAIESPEGQTPPK